MRRVHWIGGLWLALLCGVMGEASADVPEPVQAAQAAEDLEHLALLLERVEAPPGGALLHGLQRVLRAYGNFARPPGPAPTGDAAGHEAHRTGLATLRAAESLHATAARELVFKLLAVPKVWGREARYKLVPVLTHASEEVARLVSRLPDDERQWFARRTVRLIERLGRGGEALDDARVASLFDLLASYDRAADIEYLVGRLGSSRHTFRGVQFVQAALGSLARFHTRPGRLRYRVVEVCINAFAGIEAQGEEPTDGRANGHVWASRYWPLIRDRVLAVLHAYAVQPGGEAGQVAAFRRVRDFQMWFRDHKDPASAPWRERGDGASEPK